jgi:miniconductance mechanosensitive channel
LACFAVIGLTGIVRGQGDGDEKGGDEKGGDGIAATVGADVVKGDNGKADGDAAGPPSGEVRDVKGEVIARWFSAIDGKDKGTDETRMQPILKPGDLGPRVKEVQTTLNYILGGRTLDLPNEWDFDDDGSLVLWKPDDARAPRISDWPGATGDKKIELPNRFFASFGRRGKPLVVDGIYGKKTFAAVWLFQAEMKLEPTGTVDALTLDKLEPLVSPNSLLGLAAVPFDHRPELERLAQETNFLSPEQLKYLVSLTLSALILLASFVVFRFSKTLATSTQFLSRWMFTPTSSPWFTMMREKQVFLHAAQFAPAIFIWLSASCFPAPDEDALNYPYVNVYQDFHVYFVRIGLAYCGLVFALVLYAMIDAFDAYYVSRGDSDDEDVSEDSGDNPISSITGAGKRCAVLLALILIGAAFLGKNPLSILGGLGALMAIIMLVFKDAILGMVSSVQIIMHNLLEVGDWIEMPKYGADGEVLEISLSCIRVQNFDKAIAVIPTHAMMSGAFKNWSGMKKAGGRRIKRSIYLDMNCFRVCSPKMIEQFGRVELIADYIRNKVKVLDDYNDLHDGDASMVNSRQLTNIGTFRAYLEAYLESHPDLTGEMTLLVRHLQPTKEGLPVEIYAFSNTTVWKEYEAVQANIVEHILSILPEFELRAFQDMTNEPDDDRDLVEETTPISAEEDLEYRLKKARRFVVQQNRYLSERPFAKTDVAVRKVKKLLAELNLVADLDVECVDRELTLLKDGTAF